MNYFKIRTFLFKRNVAIFKDDGWNFKMFPNPYRKIKTNLNLEVSSFFLYLLNKTRIHPNLVTFFGIFWVYTGVFSFYYQTNFSIILGMVIFFTKLIPDYIDGALAYLKKKQSKKGHFFDLLAGNLNRLGFVIGTLIFIYYSSDNNFILNILILIIFLFFTDPRTYLNNKIKYDDKINSHKEIFFEKKKNIVIKLFKFFHYDGRTSYSDIVIFLIFLDYNYNISLLLNFLPWLWAVLFLLSYIQAWYKFYKKIA